MNEFVAWLINVFTLGVVVERSRLEIVSILAPSILLLIGLYGISFFFKNKFLKKTIYVLCLLFTLVFLPYELIRQATDMSKADANVAMTQMQLKELLSEYQLSHLESFADKEMTSNALEKSRQNLSEDRKQELLLVSWLIAENKKQSEVAQEESNQLLVSNIRADLDRVTEEIINSRTPVDAISDDILDRIDGDVSDLIDIKMESFNNQIDQSLSGFKEGINTFIQVKLDEYEVSMDSITQRNINEMSGFTDQIKNSFDARLNEYEGSMDSITQKNADELRNFTDQAKNAFAEQVNQSNQASLDKLQDTKKSVDDFGTKLAGINLGKVLSDVQQLEVLIKEIQERNEALFDYNECLRTVGIIDFAGKEEKCRRQLNSGEGEES